MKITNFAIATLLTAAGSVFAENLFQGDTGAEAGVEFVTQGGLAKTRIPVFHDKEIFYEGNGSLRIDWKNKQPPGFRYMHQDRYFGADIPELERDQEYTVSFYAKASEGDFPIRIHLYTREGLRKDTSHALNVRLTTEWKRYSLTFKTKVPKNFFSTAYSLNIALLRTNGKHDTESIWFDAFQLEKGAEATPYQAPAAAAELHLKSSGPMNIIGKDDKIEANVNAVTSRDGGKSSLEMTVMDWEGKVLKQFEEDFGKKFTKSYELPSGRYGWFNVRLLLKSGEKVLADLTKNYLVVRPPVKIEKGMRPFCGGIALITRKDPSQVAANRAVGVARFQVEVMPVNFTWDWEPRRGEFDFSHTDWLVEQALKNDMEIKMCITPFDWKKWHFPKEEMDEMKRCRARHTMLDLRHRELWNGFVSQVLDRYGDKIGTLEVGWEDNGRLGLNPYFKKKYPEGVQKDHIGAPWVVAGPAFDAFCTLITDACRMALKRYPDLRIGGIRPSQGRPGQDWFFVWKMFERTGKEFNSFSADTYSMVPYTIGPVYSKADRYIYGGADSRFYTMDLAKRIIKKHGCGQDVYLSETGTELYALHKDHSPYRLEEAEYLVQDMLAARCAGFTAYDSYRTIDEPQGIGKTWTMNLKNGLQMRAGAYSAVARILENVTESRWIKPDAVTRIALLKKVDGSGRGAVYSQKGYSMHVPEGIQVFDFMGNEYEPDAKRILPLSGAAWYFSAPKYETLVEKLSKPQIDQTDYCKAAFRHVTDKIGLIRFTNNSNQNSVIFECIVNNGSKEIRKDLPVMAGSWNSFRVPLDRSSNKLTVKYRRKGIDQKYLSEEIKVPEVTPIQSGNEPVSELGRMDSKNQILPNEPWTPWSGVEDLGLVLSGSWTDTELKLKAVVTDDQHHPSNDPDRPWNADSLQLAIDPKNDGAFFKPNKRDIGPDDLEFALRLGRDGKVSKVIWKGNKETKMDIQASRDEKAGTTVYEIAIPWSELGVKPFKDMVFGLSAVIFDDDSGKGFEYYGMIGGGVAGSKNPALYKRFVLKDKENGTSPVSSAETKNILRNPEFADQGKFWRIKHAKIEESIQEEDGGKVVKIHPHARINTFGQYLPKPKGGVYVYSAEFLPSRKLFAALQVSVTYRDDNGKPVYRSSKVKPAEYPEPGKWGRIVGEVKIPEDRKSVGFMILFRDRDPEGFLLIRNPTMSLKEE